MVPTEPDTVYQLVAIYEGQERADTPAVQFLECRVWKKALQDHPDAPACVQIPRYELQVASKTFYLANLRTLVCSSSFSVCSHLLPRILWSYTLHLIIRLSPRSKSAPGVGSTTTYATR